MPALEARSRLRSSRARSSADARRGVRTSGCRGDWVGSLSAPPGVGGPPELAARTAIRNVRPLPGSDLPALPAEGTGLVLGVCMPHDHMSELVLTLRTVSDRCFCALWIMCI